ncbi:tripartite tricarboxylate transporter substrate binding protein [Cupriavidus oxalaticus]|uniref:Bug family tripartite tricarboxylate transporter substrate binding protein n=1 Tax=Cupriavidus oxalaticus TaxID=96344 RepID=UPI003173A314
MRQLTRREVLKLGIAAASLGISGLPRAAGWPGRPVRLVLPSAAGGSPDAICRLLTEELSVSLGQSFIVDNKPGGAGNVGMVDLVNAAPDGYTIGYGNVGTLAINKALFRKLPYDPDRQLVPVALLGYVQNALVVRKDLGVSNVKGLIALAKSKPGVLTMGSAGNGTTGHLGGELFKAMTGTSMTHVPYRGSPQAIQDLMGGQVDLMFDNLSSISPHIKAGRLTVLAVTGAQRSRLFPETPTIAESGVPGYDIVAWGGIVAPAQTPRAIVAQLNSVINTVLAKPSVRDRYAAIGFETLTGAPERLTERVARETPLWASVVQRSGAQVD